MVHEHVAKWNANFRFTNSPGAEGNLCSRFFSPPGTDPVGGVLSPGKPSGTGCGVGKPGLSVGNIDK